MGSSLKGGYHDTQIGYIDTTEGWSPIFNIIGGIVIPSCGYRDALSFGSFLIHFQPSTCPYTTQPQVSRLNGTIGKIRSKNEQKTRYLHLLT